MHNYNHLTQLLLTPLVVAACGASNEIVLTDAEAQEQAETITGGTAGSARLAEEGGFNLWEVDVAASNGAALGVLLFADDGELFEIKDTVGPFDYGALDPLPGMLTYEEARTIAFDRVEGDQVAWEVKYKDDNYFYEFYVREPIGQLWEIKLWGDTGEVFVVKGKDEID